MSEYYAVQRSGESLAHYGVKGMQWGVRKAIATGNERALDKHYKKAQKKLQKLNKKADVDAQKKESRKYAKRAAAGLLAGAAGVGGATFGANYMKKGITEGFKKLAPSKEAAAFIDNNSSGNSHIRMYVPKSHPDYNKIEALNAASRNATNIQSALAGIGAAGIGYGTYAGVRSLAAKRRTTAKGHAKAVAKRDAWKKEMQSAFKGTEYARQISPRKSQSKSRKRR